jgi:Cytochrome c3
MRAFNVIGWSHGVSARRGANALVLLLLIATSGCNKVLYNNISDGTDASPTTGGLERESHGMFFPIGLGSYHVNQTCDDCHGGFDSFKQFTCQSCHAHAQDVAAMRHTSISDFQNDSSSCYKCHPNGRETKISVADHSAKYFAIATGPHAPLQCSDCHTWVTTSRPFTCQGCHDHDQAPTDTAHASITGYRYDSNGCYGCHPNGAEAPIATSDHSARFFPILTGSHASMTCASCHTDTTTSKSFVCTSCHVQSKSAGQHTAVSNYVWSDAGCYSCHPRD